MPPPITGWIRTSSPIDIRRQLEPLPRIKELLWAPFRAHHARLGGAPGAEMSGIEPVRGGRRVRYQNGTIYENPGGHTAWVVGSIGERYHQLEGPAGWLGFPLSDEQTLPDGGKVTVFDRGRIYFWNDVGAVDVNDVVVHYTGLHAFSETDGGGSDEPYAVIGVNSPTGQTNTRTQIYEDVDSGSTRPDLIELYRGKPDGIALTVLLMEHDEGDPEKYKALMDQVVEKGGAALVGLLTAIPVVGFVLGSAAGLGLAKFSGDISSFLNSLLGTDDDKISFVSVPLTTKQMVVLAARTPNTVFSGIGYKVETPLMSGQGGDYKVYFGLVAV